MNLINFAKLLAKFTITFLVFSLPFVLKTPVIFACSCVQLDSPLTSLNESTAVFAGQVTDIDISDGITFSSADPMKATFNVAQSWKGLVEKNTTVSTARSSASCGFDFETGREYLVYAYGNDNDLQVSLCSRTNLLARAGDDLSALGQGEIYTAEPKPVDERSVIFSSTALIIGGLTLVFALFAGTSYRIFSTQRKS